MTKEEILKSGLLELYVLGALSAEEKQMVETALGQYPDLRLEIREIEATAQGYADYQGVEPRKGLESEILDFIDQYGAKKNSSHDTGGADNANTSSSKLSWWLSGLLAALATVALYNAFKAHQTSTDLQQRLADSEAVCDSIQLSQEQQIAQFESLFAPETKPIVFSATATYPDTDLTLFVNDALGKNYIQVRTLPTISRDQAFQLWSLKDGQDPIPLTVFKGEGSYIIPVDFENGTVTYAITIEKAGGVKVPTLSRLIGTASV